MDSQYAIEHIYNSSTRPSSSRQTMPKQSIISKIKSFFKRKPSYPESNGSTISISSGSSVTNVQNKTGYGSITPSELWLSPSSFHDDEMRLKAAAAQKITHFPTSGAVPYRQSNKSLPDTLATRQHNAAVSSSMSRPVRPPPSTDNTRLNTKMIPTSSGTISTVTSKSAAESNIQPNHSSSNIMSNTPPITRPSTPFMRQKTLSNSSRVLPTSTTKFKTVSSMQPNRSSSNIMSNTSLVTRPATPITRQNTLSSPSKALPTATKKSAEVSSMPPNHSGSNIITRPSTPITRQQSASSSKASNIMKKIPYNFKLDDATAIISEKRPTSPAKVSVEKSLKKETMIIAACSYRPASGLNTTLTSMTSNQTNSGPNQSATTSHTFNPRKQRSRKKKRNKAKGRETSSVISSPAPSMNSTSISLLTSNQCQEVESKQSTNTFKRKCSTCRNCKKNERNFIYTTKSGRKMKTECLQSLCLYYGNSTPGHNSLIPDQDTALDIETAQKVKEVTAYYKENDPVVLHIEGQFISKAFIISNLNNIRRVSDIELTRNSVFNTDIGVGIKLPPSTPLWRREEVKKYFLSLLKARWHRQEADRHMKLMIAYHKRGEAGFFHFYNKERNLNVIDLHELRAYQNFKHKDPGEAIAVLAKRLDEIERMLQDDQPEWLEIIVGAGNNSRNHQQSIRPAVEDFLEKFGFEYDIINEGSLLVTYKPYTGTQPCWGNYYCVNCRQHWRSRYSWVDEYQECRKCKTECYPFRNEFCDADKVMFNTRSKPDRTFRHREVCGRCKSLWRDCRQADTSPIHNEDYFDIDCDSFDESYN